MNKFMKVMAAAADVDHNDGISADVEPAIAANINLRLVGYSCREVAGSPAVASFNIINGITVSGGTEVVNVELAADGSETKHLGDSGIDCRNGISIDIVAGTVDLQIFFKQIEP